MQTLTSTPISRLQPELIKLVKALHEDLRVRCDEVEEVNAPLLAEYQEAQQARRTQETFQAWRDNYLNQVAVAWVLAGVFVRYLEDNQLVDECWLAGEGQRKAEARERYTAFFRAHPEWSDREFFHDIFEQVSRLPGCHDLFAQDRNPLWKVGISGDGAKKLREFFAEVDSSSGALLRTFGGDTRFLGDLYQNLSEEAQKKYALLQTPDFVEEFILDRTLEPAIVEFGLEQVKLIDPTCGSGHFLLGAFARLFQKWQAKSPAENPRLLARRALEAVHGVDINPFAVAIARFRLVIAFVQACGLSRLREMPDVKVHVAAGDSLLHGNTLCSAKGWGTQELSDWLPDAFAAGDFADASAILSQRYEAVVGNPPYIVVRDKAQNQAIRDRYRTAYRQYSLAVPFKEKFWDLAIEAKGPQRAGFIGLITANSFMKREFGSRLIEEFLPRLDLTHVLDTSGAYIPGHGTPTVILLGRNRAPVAPFLRAVLAIRGEPSTPSCPAQGAVWRSIVEMVDRPGLQNAFVSVTDFERASLGKHPWSIGGGGASELKEKIERLSCLELGKLTTSIGRVAHTGLDDVYIMAHQNLVRLSIPSDKSTVLVEGDRLRDYSVSECASAILPYETMEVMADNINEPCQRALWAWRELLWNRREPQGTHREIGFTWHQYSRFHPERYIGWGIAFAEVATHNHFVLDRGGKVFKQTAPIIKLPEGASELQYLGITGLLNSSTACFWLKQVCFPKGGNSDSHGWALSADDPWDRPYQFNATNLLSFPCPAGRPFEIVSRLQKLADEKARCVSSVIESTNLASPDRLEQLGVDYETILGGMIALQEELDWECYRLYGLMGADSKTQHSNLDALPRLELGQRAFEWILAQQLSSGESNSAWFRRHKSQPMMALPETWPEEYRRTFQARLDAIQTNPEIRLVEQTEFKRRWQYPRWNDLVHSALREWLGDRIEDAVKAEDQPLSVSQLADRLASKSEFQAALTLLLQRDDYELTEEIKQLVQPQSVAYLAALRYSESGLRTRADWEVTWTLQRRQDGGEDVGDIPVPPKYGQKDFARPEYWSLRGKLDVPKERFISYPGAEREADGTVVLGWAGWNHLQRAKALAAYVVERREEDGWGAERLTPLLAGIAELLPWLKQWHNDLDPDSGERMGDYFEAFLGEQMRELELTPKDLSEWRPAAKAARKGKKA